MIRATANAALLGSLLGFVGLGPVIGPGAGPGQAEEATPGQGRGNPFGITICHAPPGQPELARTIVVSPLALPRHLAHGDTLGPCPEDFRIVSCSLGCTEAFSGQLTCTVTDIHVNEEIRVAFSTPFDLSSVNARSFQMVELATGTTPPGSFLVDPGDPRVLIYRPLLTFDSAGNPVFGLRAGETYVLNVPGTILDPLGPYVTSALGTPNATRLSCTLVASLGVLDPVPGPPTVAVSVDTVTAYDPNENPIGFATVPANGATNVWRDTDVAFDFDDLMNPATLVNPVTGAATGIAVLLDADGDPSTTGDQTPVAGTAVLLLSQQTETTRVLFDPTSSLPLSNGVQKVVVELAPTVADLAGNLLVDPGDIVFEVEPGAGTSLRE